MPVWHEGEQIAVMKERVEFSAGGNFALVLLILHNIGIFAWFASSGNAIHQAVVGTLWIGGNVLWGLGVIVGRKRSYAVFRLPDSK